MERPVHDRVMDRTAYRRLVSGLHRGHDQHATVSGLLQKGGQQCLFLLDREVLAMAITGRLVLQYSLALTKVVGMHLSHRTDLPAEGRSNLRSS